MEFTDFPITDYHSPNLNEFKGLFSRNSIDIDGDELNDIINPDEFLNLDEFHDKKIKNEENFNDQPFNSMDSQQLVLTPPISPQPNIYQKIHLIPNMTPYETKRVKKIVPKPSSSSESESYLIVPTIATLGSSVDKVLIKQQRQIRNRESANLSRIKKKEYVQTIERQNIELRKENIILKAENCQLKQRLKSYGALTLSSASTLSRKIPSKNATLLLAVVFMVGFNIAPFSNFFWKQSPAVIHQFNSRHLLFTENSTQSSNDSTFFETEAPVYFNQTDQIRKVNIDNIRRWIPQPDLFNVTYLKNDFDFNPDPLQEKLTKMYEKSREQSQNIAKNKRLPKKKPSLGPVQLYNSKMNIIKLNEFFDEINRKDDTFYVFSFKADHLLLPAIDNSYNFSQIKMNLIMPRSNDSGSNDKITMMQIETIIINTSFIQITEKSIPENFLKPSYNSSTCNKHLLNQQTRDKKHFNVSAETDDFQPLTKATKLPSYFNTLDFLKVHSRK